MEANKFENLTVNRVKSETLMLKKANRTKQLYCEALLKLSEEKPLAKITVRNLIEETETARQTFYNNFRDINDLISYLPINYLKTSGWQVLTKENARHAYEYAYEHRSFFGQLAFHTGQNNFRDTFVDWLENAYYEQYLSDDLTDNEKLHRMLAINLFAIGITNQFLEWCATGFTWPIDLLLQVQDEALPSFIKEQLPEK